MAKMCFDCLCVGKPHGCKTCGRMKVKSNLESCKEAGIKDRQDFLQWVRSGLDRFGMKSTGSPDIDRTVDGNHEEGS